MGVSRAHRPLVAAAACLLSVAIASPSRAVPPSEVPWSDSEPRYLPEADVVRAAALGAPDPRLGRLSAVKLRARREGERRARAAVHRWADDAMAEARVLPWIADDVHAIIEERSRVAGLRPLVDGGAVVLVELQGDALRSAARFEGAPWDR